MRRGELMVLGQHQVERIAKQDATPKAVVGSCLHPVHDREIACARPQGRRGRDRLRQRDVDRNVRMAARELGDRWGDNRRECARERDKPDPALRQPVEFRDR